MKGNGLLMEAVKGGVANGMDERRMPAGDRRDGRLVAAGAAKLRQRQKEAVIGGARYGALAMTALGVLS